MNWWEKVNWAKLKEHTHTYTHTQKKKKKTGKIQH